jgi:hypothetical protein
MVSKEIEKELIRLKKIAKPPRYERIGIIFNIPVYVDLKKPSASDSWELRYVP